MYEYEPKFQKKKEKLLAAAMVAVAFSLYFAVALSGIPYAGVLQLISLGLLVAAVMLLSTVILKRYCYRISPRGESGELDFTVTEISGRRRAVVCRVSVRSVVAIAPREGKKGTQAPPHGTGNRFYNYTGVLFDEARYCAEIREGGETFFLLLCADAALLERLQSE